MHKTLQHSHIHEFNVVIFYHVKITLNPLLYTVSLYDTVFMNSYGI